MNNVVKIPELIEYFDKTVRKIASRKIGDSIGKEPNYPMLVVCFGEDAINGCRTIMDNVNAVWPPYKDELLFIGVEGEGEDINYSRLSLESGDIKKTALNKNNVGDLISKLYSLDCHFQDRSKLMIYYVMETTSFSAGKDFLKWMDTLKRTKTFLGLESISYIELLTVLLNENIGQKRKIANYVKHVIANFTDDDIKSVFILSNHRNDDIILSDFKICYQIIASVIELTNNSESIFLRTLFNKGVYTASYAREEKPNMEIGQVIINVIIEYMANRTFDDECNPIDNNIDEKLGITKEHTIKFLDAYAENTLYKLLPDRETLSLFPRETMKDVGDVSLFSEKDFNLLTMNTWEAFLNSIINNAQDHICNDKVVRSQWKAEFKKNLLSNFKIDEIVWMKDHIEQIRERYIMDAFTKSSDLPVLDAAKFRLKYRLSSQKELINLFLNIITEVGEEAEQYRLDFKELVESRFRLHAIKDNTIKSFYEAKARNYFDHNKMEFMNKLNAVTNIEMLKELLLDTISRIIDYDEIFNEPFEVELDKRLQESAQPRDAKQYIRRKLTGDKVPTFFQSAFSIGVANAAAILIKTGTTLHESLKSNLQEEIYYYNTGNADSAESIKIYTIDNSNIENNAFEEE